MNAKRPTLRLDIVSRTMIDKKYLVRIVKTKENKITIDLNNDIKGRGAYLKKDIASINIAKKRNLIARALRYNVGLEIYDELLKLLEN